MTKLKSAIRYFNKQKEEAEAELKKFATTLSEHPVYALEWAESAFTAAATLQMALAAVKWLGSEEVKDETVDELREYLQKEALRKTKNPKRSTSVMSNSMDRELASVMVKMAEYLEYL
jgi:hypothetical protein